MFNKLNQKKLISIIIAITILSMLSLYLWITRNDQHTDDAAIEADIASISSKVTGYIEAVEVNDNQRVKKGDILVKVDKRDYQHSLEIAKAEYEIALQNLESGILELEITNVTVPSTTNDAQSQVDAARSKWIKAVNDLNRIKKLDNLVLSKQQFDDSIIAELTAKFELESKVAQLKSASIGSNKIAKAESKIKELQLAADKAKANLKLSELNLQDTTIVAPFDGRIVKKNLVLGNLVQPGQKLMALISDQYWVVANFKETQIKKMRPGQQAKIVIDAFPDKSFRGKVDSIQYGTGSRFSLFPPENATGNFVKVIQRIPVKITFEEIPPIDIPIAAGMSVEPIVYTK